MSLIEQFSAQVLSAQESMLERLFREAITRVLGEGWEIEAIRHRLRLVTWNHNGGMHQLILDERAILTFTDAKVEMDGTNILATMSYHFASPSVSVSVGTVSGPLAP